MLKIHEFVGSDGQLASVYLRHDALGLWLVSDDVELPLPSGALRAVMLRYGAPLEPAAVAETQGTLELPAGSSLRHVRHLAGYDVIARDYLLYAEPGMEPVCALATNVAAALRHLGLAQAQVLG